MVDFPEPDGPIMDTNSPSAISKLRFLRIKDQLKPCKYDLVIFSRRIINVELYGAEEYYPYLRASTGLASEALIV